MGKFRYLTILLLILSTSSCKDDTDKEWQKQDNRPLPPAVMEARSFFEEYVEEVEMSDQMQGLYPGNFAPDWSKAVVTVDKDAYITVNVPIVSGVVYEGTFASYYDAEEGPSKADYYTAVGQKMIVVKDPAGAFGCYIVTIIPDEANATKSSLLAAKMFDSGDQHTTFSGTTLYTMLGNGDYSVAAERYMYGNRYAATSWWWETNSEQLEKELNTLLGIKKLYAFKKTISKEDVIGANGGQWNEQTYGGLISAPQTTSSGSTSSSTPTTPMSPVDQGYYNASVNSLSPSSTSGNGAPLIAQGGSGASPSNLNNGTNNTPALATISSPTPSNYVPTPGDKDVFVNSKAKSTQRMTRQMHIFVCVPAVFAYINTLFGGDKTFTDYARDMATPTLGRINVNVFQRGLDELQTLIFTEYYFETSGYNNYIDAITNKKCVIITTIPDGGSGNRHCVLIVGYKANGDLIYIDPTTGTLQQVSQSYTGIGGFTMGIKGLKW